jgi:hypothetical protein
VASLALVAALPSQAQQHPLARASERARVRPHQSAPFLRLDDFSEVSCSNAILFRARNRIEFRAITHGLTPGDVVSIWFCGWNDPSVCVQGPGTCGAAPEDLELDVPGAFCWSGGADVVDAGGSIMVEHRAQERAPSGSVFYGEFTDAQAVEVNLVARSHGPALQGSARRQQLTTFEGGCDVNECADLQVSIFPAP